MKTIKVIFKDPEYNYKTSVSATATKESIKAYFIGQYFNLGAYPTENMQQCISVEIYRPETI